ncbi:hypothetical protein LUZ60_009336 [Juncus effusus]|nr:hypothetical protein LUZ60_009336 [Juncus effusus]
MVPPQPSFSPIPLLTPSSSVPLPYRVDGLIETICRAQNLEPPEDSARIELARLGEEVSMQLLRALQRRPIRNFTRYVVYMARNSEFATARASNSSEVLSGNESGYLSGPSAGDDSDRSSSIDLDMSERESTPTHRFSTTEDIFVNSARMATAAHHQRVRRRLELETPVEVMASASLDQNDQNAPRRVGPTWENASPEMLALGDLEFRKAFLILSYLGRAKLEDTIDVHFIRSLKDVQMDSFEFAIWRKYGRIYIKESDRRQNIDWDANKTYCYHCHVDPEGYATFKGPFLEPTKTHLQRVLGDENILQVKFEETSEDKKSHHDFLNYCFVYQKVAEQGITLGLRKYRFLVYKDGGKEEKKKNPTSSSVKCYFVRSDSGWAKDYNDFLFGKSIEQIRLAFMHIHTVPTLAKYMSRLSLILSKTISLDVDLSDPNLKVEVIEDIPCKVGNTTVAGIHTDGTGFISEDLALKCPTNIFKGIQTLANGPNVMEGPSSSKRQRSLNNELPPLLMQVRLFYNGLAAKGTLLGNKMLPKSTIQIRPSMIKVESDPEIWDIKPFNSLEVVTTSNKPKRGHLSRYLISLLHFGGVPSDFFLSLLSNALEDSEKGYHDREAATAVALNHGGMDDDYLTARLLFCGIPLDEPFVRSRLALMMDEERKSLKGGKIPVEECYYLMGTSDPTGSLGENEVCVILDNGQVSGDILVYKHPGLHTGDIHVLRATYIKDLEKIIGNSKYAIFFPVVGPRSLTDEMANSDLDGDMYWVSRNPQLLKHFTPSTPWPAPQEDLTKKSQQTNGLSNMRSDELERLLFREFLKCRFQPSHAIGAAADCWLVYMDRVLTAGVPQAEKDIVKNKMDQLVNIYYDAVDAPKTGKKVEVPNNIKVKMYPHFMERSASVSYKSTSILGQVYDKVQSFQAQKVDSKGVWKLPCFDVNLPQDCIQKWEIHYKNYSKEMSSALNILSKDAKNKACQEVLDKYKKILYGGVTEFQESTRPNEEVYNEALTIYQIAYSKAESAGTVARCNFAWRVAGHALCQYYLFKVGKPFLCDFDVLRELFG